MTTETPKAPTAIMALFSFIARSQERLLPGTGMVEVQKLVSEQALDPILTGLSLQTGAVFRTSASKAMQTIR
jgi:hypothetical protein